MSILIFCRPSYQNLQIFCFIIPLIKYYGKFFQARSIPPSKYVLNQHFDNVRKLGQFSS